MQHTQLDNTIQDKSYVRGPYVKNPHMNQYQFYHPIYTKITGNINAGLLLSMILYNPKSDMTNGIIITDKDVMKALCMGPGQLRWSKKTLSQKGIVNISRKGLPAKTHYKVNMEKVMELTQQSEK